MVRLMVVSVTSLAIALTSCQVSTSPETVATVGGRNAPTMMRAPWNGSYTLYKVFGSGKKSQRTAVQSVHLKKDDALGFRARETGQVAVAGDLEVPVSDGTYQWVMQADPGQPDPLATTILVIVIVVVVIGVAVIAVALYSQHVADHLFSP